MLFLLVSAVVVGCALSQEPRPCMTPPQWEARIRRFDDKYNVSVFAKLTYDETQRRVREIEEIDFTKERDFYDRLFLHNAGLEYRLNLRTRQCNVTSLSRPFIPFGLPPDAKFRFEGTVGAAGLPDESVTIQFWEGDFQGNPYFMEVTTPDCVPIRNRFTSTRTGTLETMFFGVVAGIPDPMVFVPPSECQKPGR